MAQMSNVENKLIAELNAIKEKHLAGHVTDAEKGYRELLRRVPGFVAALHPHGIALQQMGRHAEAVQAISRWLEVMPTDADALINLANSLTAIGQLSQAIDACRRAAAVNPGSQLAQAALAQAEKLLAGAGQEGKASQAASTPEAVNLEVKFAQANQVAAEGNMDGAIAIYQEILAINPDLPEVLVNLGNQLCGAKRAAEALPHFEKALKLRPGMREALLNMGNTLHELGENKRALVCFEKALKADPTYRDALNNLANIHLTLGQGDVALRYTRRLLELYPDHVQAHGTAAAVLLARGELKEGWEHYEWRWLKPDLPVPLRYFGCPEWTGEDISDKTILLSHEQGLGDSIQFIRFVPEVVKRAKHVVVEVPANLRALYACIPDVTLTNHKEPLPAYDVHLPLMSLPHVLGVTLANLPTPIPYLQADSDRIESWRDRLPQGGFRIGIVWQGKAGTSVDNGRSYALQHLAPVARIPGVTLISLQKGYGLDQLDNLPEDMKVVTLGPDFDEGGGAFLDTAAVMAHMDLIISSDTSVAHLAGALGHNVWVPLKLSPDWRWMLDREDCPWYPTMRLFRQREVGDWPKVFGRIAAEVAALKDGDRSRLQPPPAPPVPAVAPYPPVSRPPLPEMRPIANQRQYSRMVKDGVMETDTRHGRMRYPAHDFIIGRCLDAYGEWSEAEVGICIPLLREGDVVVEAGSNIGSHTLALGRAVGPTGRVYSFEPQKFINGLLNWNVEASGLSQIKVNRMAVGSVAGEVSIPDVDYSRSGNFGGISMSAVGDDIVPLITIDSLNLDQLRLLKADVEGMEIDVLRGAVATIKRCRPLLYLENDRNDKSDELIKFIDKLGYRLWWHRPKAFQMDNYRKNPVDIFPGLQSINMLCIPEERDAIVVGLDPVK